MLVTYVSAGQQILTHVVNDKMKLFEQKPANPMSVQLTRFNMSLQ